MLPCISPTLDLVPYKIFGEPSALAGLKLASSPVQSTCPVHLSSSPVKCVEEAVTDLLSLKLQLHLMLIVVSHPLPWLGTSGAHLTSALVFSQLGLP